MMSKADDFAALVGVNECTPAMLDALARAEALDTVFENDSVLGLACLLSGMTNIVLSDESTDAEVVDVVESDEDEEAEADETADVQTQFSDDEL